MNFSFVCAFVCVTSLSLSCFLFLLDEFLGCLKVETVEMGGHVCQCSQTVSVEIFVLRERERVCVCERKSFAVLLVHKKQVEEKQQCG